MQQDASELLSDARKRRFLFLQILTLGRIPLAFVFAAVLLGSERTPLVLLVSGMILGLADLTDFFDGILARRLGIATEWGAMVDPYADSIARITAYWALACAGLVIPLVPLAMALRDVSVAYCRIMLAKHGVSVSARRSGKIKALVQAIGAVFAVLGPIYHPITGTWPIYVVSWVVIVVTLGSLVEYAKAAISVAAKGLGQR